MQCPACKKVIQSKHRHDYVVCGCPNNATVDGGGEYLKIGWKTHMPVEYDESRAIPEKKKKH
jgi:hypothetical protein